MAIPPFGSAPTPDATATVKGKHKLTNDLGGTAALPQVVATHLSAALPINQGGTSGTTKTTAFDALSPMTTAGDLITGGASGTGGRLAMGSAAQQIRVNAGATALEYFTPSAGGGQTLVTKVVAASGGDYTTLGAALTAASSGWVIWVQPGTYTESAINIATTGITVIGAGNEQAIISMGSNAFTMSGANTQLFNLRFSFSSGAMTVSGNFNEINACHLIWSGTGSSLFTQSGTSTSLTNCYLDQQSNSTNAAHFIFSTNSSRGSIIANNRFYDDPANNSTSVGSINISGTNYLFDNNEVRGLTSHGGGAFVRLGGGNTATNNYFPGSTYDYGIYIAGQFCIVANNQMEGYRVYGIYVSGANAVVQGNLLQLFNGTAIYVASIDASITGNQCYGGGPSGTGIDVNADDCVISGNRITQHSKGVNVASTFNRATITGNALHGNTTAISDAGTGTINSGNST